MFNVLYQEVLASAEALTISAEHSETYVQIPVCPSGVRLDFSIIPAPPYYATIVHRFSYGDIVPGVFQVWAGQIGMTYHTGLITTDVIQAGITTWLIVTAKNPLTFALRNNDLVNQYWESYLWQINIYTQEELGKIREIVRKITLGVDIEELVSRLMVPMEVIKV